MEVFIVRHGDCTYSGGKVLSAQQSFCTDVTGPGTIQLLYTAGWISGNGQDKISHIYASPWMRAAQSARILQQSRIDKFTSAALVIDPKLQELEGLEYFFLKFLVEGGEYELGGGVVTVDAKLTNPFGLALPQYLLHDHAHAISVASVARLPRAVAEKIEKMETAKSGINRCRQFLRKLYSFHKGKGSHIAVTHDGLTSWLAQQYSPHLWELAKGYAIRMEMHCPGRAVMTHFGNERIISHRAVTLQALE